MKSLAALVPEFPESILTSKNRCKFNRKPSETPAITTTKFELKTVDAVSELTYCLDALTREVFGLVLKSLRIRKPDIPAKVHF